MNEYESVLPILAICAIGIASLPLPFITREHSTFRFSSMVSLGAVFIVVIFAVDLAYLEGMRASIKMLDFGYIDVAFHLEPLGIIFLNLLAVLWLVAVIYTSTYLTFNEIKRSNQFLFYLNCTVLTGVFVAMSANLITMFIFYEMMTLCTIPLIAHKSNEDVLVGLQKYLSILLISGLVLFLPGTMFLHGLIGHTNFEMGGVLQGAISDEVAIALFIMFIFGISKVALFPLHPWLPAAMIASYPVSALLHAVVVVKTGLFCIYKLILYIYGIEYLSSLMYGFNWLILLPVLTIIYSSFQALRYDKIKMILAYSTINQLSVALLGALLLTLSGMKAAIMHMIAHSFTKICLFYSAGNIYSRRGAQRLHHLAGTNSIMPITSTIMLFSGLSLIGMPPFAGFISKFSIMLAAAECNNVIVMLTLAFSAVFSALYMAKILLAIYGKKNQNSRETDEAVHLNFDLDNIGNKNEAERKFPSGMIFSLVFCFLCVVFYLGIFYFMDKFLALL